MVGSAVGAGVAIFAVGKREVTATQATRNRFKTNKPTVIALYFIGLSFFRENM
jgi:hypothetical protein